MRIARTLICLAALLAAALAPEAPRKGIELGRHRQESAIRAPISTSSPTGAGAPRTRSPPRCPAGAGAGRPASPPRTSSSRSSRKRRRRRGSPRGASSSSSGTSTGPAWTKSQTNRLGVKPLAPLLSEIDRMKNAADVRAMIGRLHEIAVRVPFALVGGSDNHKPNDVIAQIYAERPRHARPRLLREAGGSASRKPARSTSPTSPRSSGWPARARPGEDRRGHGPADGDEARRELARQRGPAGPEGDRPQDLVRRPPEDDARLQLDGLLPPRAADPGRPRKRGAAEDRRRQRRRAEVPRGVQPPADGRSRSPTGRPTSGGTS